MIKFQYNKTSLGELGAQLKVRQRALPTIKSKESALRVEVKKARAASDDFRSQLDELTRQYDYMMALWSEFDAGIVSISDVRLAEGKVAGVRVPVLEGVDFAEREWNAFARPAWTATGVELVKKIGLLLVESEVFGRRAELLDHARRKTTQKVNLYEKVQIPGYEDAIRKIKRFLEDEENLSKSAQKIVRNRQMADAAAAVVAAAGAGKEAER